jgi:hypothetical protein
MGAYLHGERHLAWSLVYLLRSFHCCGGRISSGEVLQLSDCSGISFRGRPHTNASLLWRGFVVGSVSEGGHTPMLDYCGGVFHSELTVCICSSFGGFERIYEGRTWLIWTCIPSCIKLLLYQVHLYFVLVVFHHLFSSYIDIYPKLVFPGGFYPGSC